VPGANDPRGLAFHSDWYSDRGGGGEVCTPPRRESRLKNEFSRGGAYAHRYWSDELRANKRFREIAFSDPAVQAWLEREGLRWEDVPEDYRGGAHRFPRRPSRDWLHLHRGGSPATEARRWNADLERFRAFPREMLRYNTSTRLFDARLGPELDAAMAALGDDTIQRAFGEYLAAGGRDRDATADEIKDRRKMWRRAPRRRSTGT
jgi:hypothetical protein